MILAQVTASAPWWQGVFVPAGVIIAALIAGWVASRTSRKTPHENLRELVEIHDKLSRGTQFPDETKVLEAAIRHEIENIDELRKAREAGAFAYVKQLVGQRPARTLEMVALAIAIASLVVAGIPALTALEEWILQHR